MRANGNDVTNAFMTTDKRNFCIERPIPQGSMQICVANTGAVEFDKTFAGGKVCLSLDGVVVLHNDRTTALWNDSSGLNLGNIV